MLKTADLREEHDSGQLLYSTEACSVLLNISRSQLYKEMAAKRLTGLLIGRRRLVSRAELERYIEERERLSA